MVPVLHSLFRADQLHSDDMSFKHETCGAQFGANIHLNNHNVHYHTGDKSYNIEMCSAQFGQTGDLKIIPVLTSMRSLSVTHYVPSLLSVVT